MKKIITVLALMLIQSSYAFELAGDNGVEIMAIDGKKVKSSLLSESTADVESGKHQVVVRYIDQFSDNLVKSRPAIFTIDVSDNTKITAPEMKNARVTKRKIDENITWLISSKSGEYTVTDSEYLEGKGFLPYADIEGLIADYNEKNGTVIVSNHSKATNAATTTLIATSVANGENALISLYQQSSKEQKKAFRIWLLEQDLK